MATLKISDLSVGDWIHHDFYEVDMDNTVGRSTVTIHNITISKPTATEALILMYKVLKLRGAL